MSEQEQVETLTVDGVDVVSYVPAGDSGRWAERAVALVPIAEAVPAILAEMPGWDFVADTDSDPDAGTALSDALIDAGAVVRRHALGYTFSLADGVDPAWADPPLSEDTRLETLFGASPPLVQLNRRAFGPGHPDHEFFDADTAVELAKLFDGATYGELLVGTAQVLRADQPIAALIINRFAGHPPYGGPWITDVFRDPDDVAARGLGGVLIRRALALLAEAGEPALTLAVTAGNPAVQRYEALGFTRCWEARRLRLPPR